MSCVTCWCGTRAVGLTRVLVSLWCLCGGVQVYVRKVTETGYVLTVDKEITEEKVGQAEQDGKEKGGRTGKGARRGEGRAA